MKILSAACFAVCLPFALVGCAEVDEEYQYVRIEETTYSFADCNNEPLTIRIDATPAWEAEQSASWIEIVDRTDSSITIGVSDNDLDEERTGKVLITAGNASAEIVIVQLPHENDSPLYTDYGRYPKEARMSPSGRYVVGIRHEVQPDNTFLLYPTFHDLQTGDVTVVGPISNTQFAFQKVHAVTDQGVAFIYESRNVTVGVSIDGDVFELDLPDGYMGGANVQGCSADGRIWVGYATKTTGVINPIIWEDGVPRELEKPELNYRGDAPAKQVMARGCSADGSIIYGTQWDNFTTGMIYWKDGKVENVGKDIYRVHEEDVFNAGSDELVKANLVDGMRCTAELTKMSAGGRWIAGMFQKEFANEEGMQYSEKYPAFYNTETETTIVLEDEIDCKGVAVTDDGIAIVSIGTSAMTSGYVVDLNTGANLGDCLSWLRDKYGIILTQGYIIQFTPDMNVVFGRRMTESAQGVGFCTWSVSPRV